MTGRVTLKFCGGLFLAAGLLWWVLRDVDRALLVRQLRTVSWTGVLLCVVLNIGHNVFRVWRWRALLAPVRAGIPFLPMFSAVIVGYMTSWVLPGRIGELVRPLALAGHQRLPLGACIGSVVVDRLLDAAAVVVLFAAGAWLAPPGGPWSEWATVVRGTALAAALLVLAAIGGMLLLSSRGAGLEPWLAGRGKTVQWLARTLRAVADGARALRTPRLALAIAAHTLAAWLTIALATWVGVRAAGADVTFAGVLTILPLLVLGVAVPTPGGAGSYHGLMKVGLTLLGASQIAAVSAGLVVHAAITVPVILLGLILLWTDGIALSDLVAGARQFRTLGAAVTAPGPAVGSVP